MPYLPSMNTKRQVLLNCHVHLTNLSLQMWPTLDSIFCCVQGRGAGAHYGA